MDNKFVLAIIAIIFVTLFLAGSLVGDDDIDVAGCTAKWSSGTVTVLKSDLCSGDYCTAQPADQQHNAIVDAVLCACEKAKAQGYTDENINGRIEEIAFLSLKYQTTAAQLCEQPGIILIKHSYG